MQSFSKFFGKKESPALAFQSANAEAAPVVDTLPNVTGGVAPGPEAAPAPAPKGSGEKPYPWILSPVIDSLFACGGLLWLLFGCYTLGAHPALDAGIAAGTMWFIAKFGLITFSYGHQPATLWRVYLSKHTREKCGRQVTFWAAITMVMLGCGIFIPGFANVFVKLVIWWQIQHVLAQSYGVALIYCYKRGYFLNDFEKRIFYWMINGSIAYFIIRACTFPEFSKIKLPYGLEVPFWGPLPEWVFYGAQLVVAGLTATFLYNIYAKYKRDGKMFPVPALCGVATGLLTYHFTPLFFHSGFSLLTIAFYHGCQYLVVTSAYYLKERGLPEGMSTSQISKLLMTGPSLRYFAILAIVGLLMSDTFPRVLAAYGVGIGIAATYTAVFAAVNFHHYFSDALIWRLKDPEVRKLLVS